MNLIDLNETTDSFVELTEKQKSSYKFLYHKSEHIRRPKAVVTTAEN